MLALLVGALLLVVQPIQRLPFASDPRFVATTRPSIGLASSPTLTQRVLFLWLRIRQRFEKPRPLAYSFTASPTNRCSIHGLLNQCMEVTGVRYAIARDVAAGTIEFGHTNTLNGVQWVSAFTDALQHNQAEWWDSQAKGFHKESLVLLTNDARTVLVLPKTMVQEFQRR